MVLVAIPIVLNYGLGIIVAAVFGKNRQVVKFGAVTFDSLGVVSLPEKTLSHRPRKFSEAYEA